MILDKKVDPRLLSRGYTKEALEQMQAAMAKLPTEIISLDVHLKCSLEEMSFEGFSFAIISHDAYIKHGVLPYPGSLADQPNKIIEIFNTLDALKAERDKKAAEDQHRESNRKRKRK